MSAARRMLGRRTSLVVVAAIGAAVAAVAVPRLVATLRARSSAPEAEFFESAGMARAGPPLENADE